MKKETRGRSTEEGRERGGGGRGRERRGVRDLTVAEKEGTRMGEKKEGRQAGKPLSFVT